jgi:hypothetical protein
MGAGARPAQGGHPRRTGPTPGGRTGADVGGSRETLGRRSARTAQASAPAAGPRAPPAGGTGASYTDMPQ